MRILDLFGEDSPRYRHLSPGRRRLRASNLRVIFGFIVFSLTAIILAVIVKFAYDNRALFLSWP
jgi:hypothetical protein